MKINPCKYCGFLPQLVDKIIKCNCGHSLGASSDVSEAVVIAEWNAWNPTPDDPWRYNTRPA